MIRNVVLAIFVAIISLSCVKAGGIGVVSFTDACTGAPNRRVSVAGIITNPESTCSSGSGTECTMWLSDPEGKHDILFNLVKGSGPNQAEKGSNDRLTIRDSKGNVVDTSAKVVLTGKTTLLSSSSGTPFCTLDDTEISR
ncbi:MAG: hypothetical protein WBC19_12925 [Pyrinomonadaceae bacterium]|nr:hypothetical protein [Chloracidobacterium sp.]